MQFYDKVELINCTFDFSNICMLNNLLIHLQLDTEYALILNLIMILIISIL